MFARIHTLLLFFLLALCASATVLPRNDGDSVSCDSNSGTQQCCDSLDDASNPVVSLLAGLLGIVGDLIGQVGLTCTPITVVGAGTTQCNSQAVCCSGDSFSGGLLVLGCSPINVNL